MALIDWNYASRSELKIVVGSVVYKWNLFLTKKIRFRGNLKQQFWALCFSFLSFSFFFFRLIFVREFYCLQNHKYTSPSSYLSQINYEFNTISDYLIWLRTIESTSSYMVNSGAHLPLSSSYKEFWVYLNPSEVEKFVIQCFA